MDKAAEKGISRITIIYYLMRTPEFKKICTDLGIIQGYINLNMQQDDDNQNSGGNGEDNTIDEATKKIGAFVTNLYLKIILVQPAGDKLADWTSKLKAKTVTAGDLISTLLASNEYIARDLNNTDFVTMLYNVLFNREPHSGGLSYWAKQLDGGMRNLL